MAPIVSKLTSPTSVGDVSLRDLYSRHLYQREEGDVENRQYTLVGSTAHHTVSQTSSRNTDGSGAYKLFVKTASTVLDTSTDTPVVEFETAGVTVNTQLMVGGAINVNGLTIGPNGTSCEIKFPTTGAITDLVFKDGSSNTLAAVDSSGNFTVTGTLTVDSDILATSDMNVTGDATMYGNASIEGSLSLLSNEILIGASTTSTSQSGAGLYVGTSTSSTVATLQYKPTASRASSHAWTVDVPVVCASSGSGSEVSTSDVTVYTSSAYTQMQSDSLNFSNKWRMRYDQTADKLVIEYNTGTAWITKSGLAI